jgi:hypothetical protein
MRADRANASTATTLDGATQHFISPGGRPDHGDSYVLSRINAGVLAHQ